MPTFYKLLKFDIDILPKTKIFIYIFPIFPTKKSGNPQKGTWSSQGTIFERRNVGVLGMSVDTFQKGFFVKGAPFPWPVKWASICPILEGVEVIQVTMRVTANDHSS